MERLPAVYGASPIYWLISMVTADKHYRIRCTHYTPELLIPALFGRRRVTHEPRECVPLVSGWPPDIAMECALCKCLVLCVNDVVWCLLCSLMLSCLNDVVWCLLCSLMLSCPRDVGLIAVARRQLAGRGTHITSLFVHYHRVWIYSAPIAR